MSQDSNLEARPLGEMSPEEREAYYARIGETETTEGENDEEDDGLESFPLLGGKNKNRQYWESTQFAYAFVPLGVREAMPLRGAMQVEGDQNLRGKKLDVILSRFRVYRYPGGGMHTIQLNFTLTHLARPANSAPGTPFERQPVTYGIVLRSKDENAAADSGVVVFRDWQIADEAQLQIEIINLLSQQDKAIIGLLESENFKKGLQLAGTINPALNVVGQLVGGITKNTLSRNENAVVSRQQLGLFIDDVPGSLKLQAGAYIIAQVLEPLNWADWQWDPDNGIVRQKGGGTELPYNYLVVSLVPSRNTEEQLATQA